MVCGACFGNEPVNPALLNYTHGAKSRNSERAGITVKDGSEVFVSDPSLFSVHSGVALNLRHHLDHAVESPPVIAQRLVVDICRLIGARFEVNTIPTGGCGNRFLDRLAR